MLLAMLNCCTKEELEESSDEETLTSPTRSEESIERRKVIKNKILAVGRMSRVFALLRYVTFPHYPLIYYLSSSYVARSPRRCLNLRTFLALGSFPMVRWH